MDVYFASPRTQQQAEHVCGRPVLLSYGCYSAWLDKYQHTFSRVLIDSGAYSAMNSGKPVDVLRYAEWSERWVEHAEAIAGLDDIDGDWRRSMENYKVCGFPTIHDTDPPELLDDLIPIARERGGWLGIGLKPPRESKSHFVRSVCDRVPDDIHIHGWALRKYTNVRRIDSVDSTNWWRDAMIICKKLPWVTYGESLDLIMLRYEREARMLVEKSDELVDSQLRMFS